MFSVIEVSESTVYLYWSLSKDSLVNQVSGSLGLVDLANRGTELGSMKARFRREERRGEERKGKERRGKMVD